MKLRFADPTPEAVRAVGDCPVLRIGVWHHGLESHRNRPDRLTFENLTALVTSGIKVGFHGHVHKSHAQLHRFITDDFALVSTGTLGSHTLIHGVPAWSSYWRPSTNVSLSGVHTNTCCGRWRGSSSPLPLTSTV